MARISLVLPVPAGRGDCSSPASESIVSDLEASGHEVEVVWAGQGAENAPGTRTAHPGLTAALIEALTRCRGDLIVLLDPCRGYVAADVASLVATIDPHRPAVVVGSSRAAANSAPGLVGKLLLALTGSTDPFSGLVALSRPALESRKHAFDPAGSWFALEILAKVPGSRQDLPVRPAHGPLIYRPGIDDIRHFKKLADHRYGNLSRLVQFCLVGASGMVVDLSCYALFQWLLRDSSLASRVVPGLGPLDLAVAAFLAVGLALCWNFSLNRRLTFSYARHGSLVHQFFAYVLSNLLAVSLNLLIRLHLPQYVAFFAAHKLAAAVTGIVLATAVSFSMSRWVVFRKHRPHTQDSSPTPGSSPSSPHNPTMRVRVQPPR